MNGKAIDQAGNGYEIKGILIVKQKKPDAFYDNTTSFFKAACPDGTRHEAYKESPGIVTLR